MAIFSQIINSVSKMAQQRGVIMNTDYFQYIIEVANQQSISKAAETLHIQRAHLSKIITAVEQELNTTIFVRTPKGIVLTKEGEHVLQQSKIIIQALEQIKTPNSNMEQLQYFPEYTNTITLFSPPHVRPLTHSSQYLPIFHERFPNVSVAFKELKITKMFEAVEKTPLSVAATFRSDLSPDFCRPIPPNITFYQVGEVPLVALASPTNKLAQSYHSISLATLAKQKLALFSSEDDEDSIENVLLSSFEGLTIQYRVSNFPLLYQMLTENDCFSIGYATNDAQDDLLQIPIRDNIILKMGFLYHNDTYNDFVGKGFINTLIEHYSHC